MYELVALQEGHAFTDIVAHFQELGGFQSLPMTLQVTKQATVGYILSYYVDGVFLRAHAIEFNQLGMAELPEKE